MQAVKRSPPAAGDPSSRLRHSMFGFLVDETESVLRFLGVSPTFPCHKFHSTIYPHSLHSFHFICPCDDASGMVGRHPCKLQTFNIGASSHHIPRPGPVDMSGDFFNY